MIRRREFITLVGGAVAAWPKGAWAQPSERVRRIGILVAFSESDPEIKKRLAAFHQGLEKLGWSQGSNIHIDARYAPPGTPAQSLAKELIALKPDVIFTASTPMAAAVHRETREIPTVFVSVSDPIGSSFIGSLARPGGNLTGLLLFEEGITGKWLALLKEIAPSLSRVGLLANPKTTPYEYFLRSAVASAPSLAIEIVPSRVENAADIERSINSLASMSDSGLLLPSDSTITSHRDLIVALAARHRLPAVYAVREFVASGGLIYYGTDRAHEFRQGAAYVDRILRGASPANLPVQTPTKYETVVNLKTAKTLGLTIPPKLLFTADEVIE